MCDESVEAYIVEYEMCRFVFPDGQPCTSRPAKLHHHHTSRNQQIEPGLFVSTRQWAAGGKREWIRDIEQNFVQAYKAFLSRGTITSRIRPH